MSAPVYQNSELLAYLQASPTPFHAVAGAAAMLDAAGFQQLSEADAWSLDPAGRYYVTRNDSSLIAFSQPGASATAGLRMLGAHTDSPCLKLKPQPELSGQGYLRLGVETYGGVLLNPWFDRDLGLAGRVSCRTTGGALVHPLINFQRAVATIPSLAIHLDREANNQHSINSQKDIPPLVLQLDEGESTPDMRALLLAQAQQEHPELDLAAVLDFELAFFDLNPPALTGLRDQFIASARLDNLLSCHISLRALIDAAAGQPALVVLNDHEEVGSASSSGANGPFLRMVLERLWPTPEAYARAISQSIMISCDNAHAVHPNFADRHDSNHGPTLNGGPVIKVNANQRYASNSTTQALFRDLAAQAGVPVQTFVTRTDLACGSTIGPITAAEIGVRTLDVGVPQFAMHSIRELCGAKGPAQMYQVLAALLHCAGV